MAGVQNVTQTWRNIDVTAALLNGLIITLGIISFYLNNMLSGFCRYLFFLLRKQNWKFLGQDRKDLWKNVLTLGKFVDFHEYPASLYLWNFLTLGKNPKFRSNLGLGSFRSFCSELQKCSCFARTLFVTDRSDLLSLCCERQWQFLWRRLSLNYTNERSEDSLGFLLSISNGHIPTCKSSDCSPAKWCFVLRSKMCTWKHWSQQVREEVIVFPHSSCHSKHPSEAIVYCSVQFSHLQKKEIFFSVADAG